MQDWDAGHLGFLPASASAFAAGEEPEPCLLCASVYPALRRETPDGVFAPHRICGEFFPSEGSKALKYPLSSVPMHPQKGGYALSAVAQFPQNGTAREPGSGPEGKAHAWEPHNSLRQPSAALWVQAPRAPTCCGSVPVLRSQFWRVTPSWGRPTLCQVPTQLLGQHCVGSTVRPGPGSRSHQPWSPGSRSMGEPWGSRCSSGCHLALSALLPP